MKEERKKEIQNKLIEYAKKMLSSYQENDSETIEKTKAEFVKYLSQKRDDLMTIYKEDGPGCDYLNKGYELVSHQNINFDWQYQECMRLGVADDVFDVDA